MFTGWDDKTEPGTPDPRQPMGGGVQYLRQKVQDCRLFRDVT